MKKRGESGLRFLVLLTVMLLSQNIYAQPAPIVLKFGFPEPQILRGPTYDNITYDSIIMPGLDKHGAPGLPVLPFKTVRILLSQNGDLENIEIITGKKVTLDGRYKIEYGGVSSWWKNLPKFLNIFEYFTSFFECFRIFSNVFERF